MICDTKGSLLSLLYNITRVRFRLAGVTRSDCDTDCDFIIFFFFLSCLRQLSFFSPFVSFRSFSFLIHISFSFFSACTHVPTCTTHETSRGSFAKFQQLLKKASIEVEIEKVHNRDVSLLLVVERILHLTQSHFWNVPWKGTE